VYNK